MKRSTVIRELNRLGKQVNEKYPYINNGGCGVFAAMIGQALLAKGITVRTIVASNWWDNDASIDKARENVKRIGRKMEWEDNGVSFSHVGVEFEINDKVYHYDSNGAHRAAKKLDGLRIMPGRMTVRETVAIAREKDGWNDSFNRRHIPAIRRMVKYHFAQM